MYKVKAFFEKVAAFISFYGRSVTEIIDLFKDITYAATVDHVSFAVTIFLWFFSLFALIYSITIILLMSQ